MDTQQQLADFNSELGNYNASINNYLTSLNEFKQEAIEQQQKNEQLGSFFEGTGLIGMDVVHKIISSKGFAYLTAYLKKQFQDPNSLPSQWVNATKGKFKTVVGKALGVDLNDGNSVWGDAFNAMNLSKDDFAELSKGNMAPLRQKLQDQFIKTVQENAPKLVKRALKSQGIDLDAPSDSKYLDQLQGTTGITMDDLVSAGRGDFNPILQKVEPVLRKVVADRLGDTLKIPDEFQQIKDGISQLPLNEVKEALKGNYEPALSRLSPIVKQAVTEKIKNDYGIDLENSTDTSPLSLTDIQNAMKGNYDGLLDGVKDKVTSYVAQKVKEQTGIDINASKSKYPIDINDLRALSQGDYKGVLYKYLPQIKQYVGQKIKEQTGLDLDANANTKPIDISDLQELGRGNYEPILSKYKGQLRTLVKNKVKEQTGVDIDTTKYDSPVTMDDIVQMGRGNYRPVLDKYSSQLQQRAQPYMDQAEAVRQQAEAVVEQTRGVVQQTQEQVGTARDQLRQQYDAELQQYGRRATVFQDDMADILPAPQKRTLLTAPIEDRMSSKKINYNPVFDPNFAPSGSVDVSGALRGSGARMLSTASEGITETGNTLLRSIGETSAGILGTGAMIGANFGIAQLPNETDRNLAQVGSASAVSGGLTLGSRLMSGATAEQAVTEGATSALEGGAMIGAQIGASYIPNPTYRFATETAINLGMVAPQVARTATAIASNATTATTDTASTLTADALDAGESMTTSLATDFTTIGTDLAEAEVVTAPIDAVPVAGEVLQAGIGLAGLGLSVYFGIKDLFGDSSSAPPPPPKVAEPSFQSGI
jgi:ElaB/YqjD/DUF883 family membrane-anchored ribosome-binding protein